MEAYKLWVRKNREFVHSLESLANGITWLLPERFSNSEIRSEAVYSLLGIVSTVNQHIIDTTPTRTRPHRLGESTFPWSLCVSTLKDVEAVVEVAAQHFAGEDRKWNYLTVTEAVKAFVRLAAFRDSGYRMLLQGGEMMNMDERLVYHRRSGDSGIPGGYYRPGYIHDDSGIPGGYYRPGYIHDHHGTTPSGLKERAISALSCFGENAKMASDPMWFNRLRQNSEASACPISNVYASWSYAMDLLAALLVEKPTCSTLWFQKGLPGRLFLTGEVLFILRPLIYVLFIRRYGIRSWRPWLISLAVDLTGMCFLSHSTTSRHGSDDKYYRLSTSEKDELKRRKLVWALYIMRDPFFSKYTKDRLEKSDGYLNQVPLIGSLRAKLVELIVGAQKRYTYTSGS